MTGSDRKLPVNHKKNPILVGLRNNNGCLDTSLPEVMGFKGFKQTRSNLRVEIGVIRHAEFSEIISFQIRQSTSGLNRKLSIFS